MSFLTSRHTILRRIPGATASPLARRALTISSARRAGGDSHAEGEKIEHVTEQEVKASKEGKNTWNQELSTQAEADVRADQDPEPATKEHVKKLQEETVKKDKS